MSVLDWSHPSACKDSEVQLWKFGVVELSLAFQVAVDRSQEAMTSLLFRSLQL